MNVKNLLLVLLSCWFHLAQSQTWQWLQTAGNEHENNLGRAICHDLSGNVIVTGYHHPVLKLSVYPQQQQLFSLINQVNKEQRFFLAKYAPEGKLEWAALSRGGRAEGTDICSGRNDGLFVCGNAHGKVSFDKAKGSSKVLYAREVGQAFLAHYQADAHLAWIAGLARTEGRSYARAVQYTEDMILVTGDLELLAGSAVSFENARGEAFTFTPVQASLRYQAKIGYLAMYSSLGEFLGVKFFGNNKSQLRMQDIALGADNKIYLSARFSGDWFYQGQLFRTAPFAEEGLLLAMNKKGKLLWTRQLKGALDASIPLKLAQSADGINLSFASKAGIEIWEGDSLHQKRKSGKALTGVLRWDENGKLLWQHFLSVHWGRVAIQSLAVGPDQQLYAAGFFLGKWFNHSENLNTTGFHSRPFGGNGYISWWDVNAFWIQLSADGKLQWQESSEGIHKESVSDLSVDLAGNLATTGTFQKESETQFGPIQAAGMSGTNIFVAQLKPQLEPLFSDVTTPDSLVKFDPDRLLEEGAEIAVHGNEIEILLWDNNEIDGDTISLFCNEKCILSRHPLNHDRTRLKLSLEAGQSFQLRFQAENTGAIYPNTAAMTIIDDRYRQTVFLASDLNKTQAVRLLVDGKKEMPAAKD